MPSYNWVHMIMGVLLLLLLAFSIFASLPYKYQPPAALVALGVIGLWRYSWGGLHLLRSMVYRQIVFPKIIALPQQVPVYCLVMSYQTEHTVFEGVFRRLFEEAQHSPLPITIIAAVTNYDEQLQVEALFNQYPAAKNHLVTMPQDGTGKRKALANALRALRNLNPPENALSVFMDGDSLVPKGCFEKLSGYFSNLKVGALTVNNSAIVKGNNKALQHWYNLKHAQRNWLMGSMSLSKCLLVLTGRFSMFRAKLVCQPSFIEKIEKDHLQHWFYGKVNFVTGEDKSSWLWLLERHWQMLYIPNITVQSIETPKDDKFFRNSKPLMRRWYGNMYRAGRKAINMGPVKMPPFTWWSLVDQFIAPWTTLSAPVALILLGVQGQAFVPLLALYLLWVLFTRTVYTLIVARHCWHPIMPFLLYYNQLVGAWVKLGAIFHPQQQGWTGQFLPLINAVKKPQNIRTRLLNSMQTATQLTVSLTFVYGISIMLKLYGG